MRELVYYVAVSIDGFIAAPDGSFDAFLTDGDHMAVVTGDYADALPAHVLGALGITPPQTRFDTVIQGWNSYAVAHDLGIDRPYAHLREYVATRKHTNAIDGVHLTQDAVSTVRNLKQEDGLDIFLCGGGELAGALFGEIDRLILKRNPVVLGAGIPLFGQSVYSPHRLQLRRSQPFQSGVIVEEYARNS